jgi:hypothetical protein
MARGGATTMLSTFFVSSGALAVATARSDSSSGLRADHGR